MFPGSRALHLRILQLIRCCLRHQWHH